MGLETLAMDRTAIVAALEAGNRQREKQGKGEVPGVGYLFRGEDPFVLRKRMGEEAAYSSLILEMREEANRLLQEPIPALPYSLFKLFETSGTRLEYERPYFARRKRLTAFALMSWLEPERTNYADALVETIWTICDEFTWCLPAHLSGSSETNSDVGAVSSLYAEAPRVQVDLFAAETAFALSEIASLLEGQLPPLVYKRIVEEVFRRVLRPFVKQRQTPFGWETVKSNWASVCAGSIGAAAIYLLGREDQAEELAAVLEPVLPALDSFLSSYAEDGACTEGYGYWQYGFGYYVYFADLLEQRTAGLIDCFSPDKVHAIALFQQACFLDGRQVVSFSDSAPEAGVFMGLAHDLHARYPDVAAPETALRAAYAADHCGRWAPAARNLFWFRPEAGPGQSWPAGTTYLGDAQWLVSRCNAQEGGGGERRYAFAAKGGHNDEPHNHNDLGHFILYGGGTAFLMDLGSGMYTRDYFRAGRYEILCNGSQGHSVPIINGGRQQPGAGYRAQVREVSLSEDEDRFSMDLAGAYDCPALQQLERTFIWRKNGDGVRSPVLYLEDRYAFSESPQNVVERFVTRIRPSIEDDGAVLLVTEPSDAAAEVAERLRITFDAQLAELCVVELEHIDHYGQPVPCFALDFTLKKRAVQMQATFTFSFE